jgi:hypothetical protein
MSTKLAADISAKQLCALQTPDSELEYCRRPSLSQTGVGLDVRRVTSCISPGPVPARLAELELIIRQSRDYAVLI